ncbi:hypothetical protein [Erythrobacter litoralis]|uniref:Uncharacterized protein n=1 Tax=Erythrobacter litoralis (strain HTCC2594) TaxID=314225 RepID=Q2N9D0_ERYLH|nr:hypothetical protein [Erythrobacter litoralis]ABC63711.1 hypothetical protein ELI_08095 [Erythrobacter litoralis HTCC2594]
MHFRLLAVGENFPMVQDGEKVAMGWFKTVWVNATDLEEAKSRALGVIGDELREAGIRTGIGSSVSWDEIEEIEEGEALDTPSGFTFFEIEN